MAPNTIITVVADVCQLPSHLQPLPWGGLQASHNSWGLEGVERRVKRLLRQMVTNPSWWRKNDVIANKLRVNCETLRIYCDIRQEIRANVLQIAFNRKSFSKLSQTSLTFLGTKTKLRRFRDGFVTAATTLWLFCDYFETHFVAQIFWTCSKLSQHNGDSLRLNTRKLGTHANVSRHFGNSQANFSAICRRQSQPSEILANDTVPRHTYWRGKKENKTKQTLDAPITTVCATTAEKPSIWAPRSLQPITHSAHSIVVYFNLPKIPVEINDSISLQNNRQAHNRKRKGNPAAYRQCTRQVTVASTSICK